MQVRSIRGTQAKRYRSAVSRFPKIEYSLKFVMIC